MPTARARQLRCALKLAVLGKISVLRRRLPRGFSPAVVFGSAVGGHFSPDRLTWVVGRSRVVFLRPVYGFPTYYQGSSDIRRSIQSRFQPGKVVRSTWQN